MLQFSHSSNFYLLYISIGDDSKRISKLQMKAIRIIDQGNFFAHSDPAFKINDIHLHQKLKSNFKLFNNILPDHFYEFSFALIHDYNTRGDVHFKHGFARNFIRNQLPHLLNTTHLSITEKVTHSYS